LPYPFFISYISKKVKENISEWKMPKILWALMDNRRGSVGQARGVIGALDKTKFTAIEKKIDYTRWAALPNFMRGRSLLGVAQESRNAITEPFPDYVLSISRRTVPIARYIKKHSPQTKLIQLMHPGNAGLTEFDLVVAPEHDKNKKTTPNVYYIVGCPHRITAEYLQEAKQKWAEKFADLPKPLTALIIGGAIKGRPFTEENAEKLGAEVRKLKERIGGSLLVTTSRRTGESSEKAIMSAISDIPQYDFLWGDKGDNPYAGFLACADNLVVTGDSVSMCCEATATGKPIYLFCGENWLTAKHLRFVNSICAKGCAVKLDATVPLDFKPTAALNAAVEIADMIAKL
jgi:hypothetical protein